MEEYLLEMKNIHKRFPGVYALKGASLQLRAGECHALVGENGAGKSTLINVLGGIYPKDEGQILIEGKEVHIDSILDGRAANISIIHQELCLEPYLTVAENVFINREPLQNGFIDYKTMYAKAQKAIDELGLKLNARDKVYRLTIAQQQMVEIVKAVSFNSRIIVMDEPTSSISDKEVAALFECVRSLKARGIGIIYISHRLSELAQICDSVTIMRDGEYVGTYRVGEIDNDEIVRQMVGREITHYYTRTFREPGESLLRVENVSSSRVHDVSFELHAGEILGFAGLVGAGRSETMEALLGFDKITSGKVYLNGKEASFRSPREAYENGIGFTPEDRRGQGIIPLQTVKFNLTIKILQQFIQWIKVDRQKETQIVDRYVKALSIRTPSDQARVQNLSGGNQQKVVIASWLASSPKIIIMDEPTRGIDVGAKSEIYALMNELASNGIGIIMISSELPEILNMSDRIVVMREGTVSQVIDHANATQEEVMKYAVNL